MLTVITLFFTINYTSAEPYKPFIAKQYSPKQYTITRAEFRYGGLRILIIEAKRAPGMYSGPPYACRAWIDVKKANKSIFRNYFGDMEPVGFSYGLFVPSVQPPSPYFAVVKNGDYDGRLYLIREDGRVFDLPGGIYFISKDKQYIFSEHVRDNIGLIVFDLRTARTVFTTSNLPAEIYQWYEKDNTYFFTTSEDDKITGITKEVKNFAYFYDVTKHNFIKKDMTTADFDVSTRVSYDFNPGEYEDCKITHNKQLKPDAQ